MGIAARVNGQAPADVPLQDINLGTIEFWEQDDAIRDGAFSTLRRESPITFFREIESDDPVDRLPRVVPQVLGGEKNKGRRNGFGRGPKGKERRHQLLAVRQKTVENEPLRAHIGVQGRKGLLTHRMRIPRKTSLRKTFQRILPA